MFVRRLADASSFDAPNHRDVIGLMLQHVSVDDNNKCIVCCSQYFPGGGAGPDATPFDKIYVVLSGYLTIRASGQEAVLGPMDSCVVPASETRKLHSIRRIESFGFALDKNAPSQIPSLPEFETELGR